MAIELRAVDRSELPAAIELLARSCKYDDAALVADEVLFGRAPGVLRPRVVAAFHGGQMCGICATGGRWLRILAVDPNLRDRGVGTALLAAAESGVIGEGHDEIRVLAQPGNYLAPGIDTRNTETIAWMVRRGYEASGRNTNLLIEVRDNPKVSQRAIDELSARARAGGYRIERAALADAPELAATVRDEFSESWAFELERGLHFEPPGVHIARTGSGELAAFAVHDGNNTGLGWFGPAGTWPAHRGRGLGAALLMACLVDVARDHAQCTIAWIGPREFYDHVAGISSERHYTVMRKTL